MIGSKWITEGSEIDQDYEKFETLIYQNGDISAFLSQKNKRFIIAGKGVGKSYLLAYKRYLLENDNKNHGILFLPKDKPYIGFIGEISRTLDHDKMSKLTDVDFCCTFFECTLKLYLLAATMNNNQEKLNEIEKDFSSYRNYNHVIGEIIRNNNVTISHVFNHLIALGISQLQQLFTHSSKLTSAINKITHGVYLFLDRMDQAIKRRHASVWISLQNGLLQAAWNIMKNNTHITIFLSSRKEAWDSFASGDREAISSSVSEISYTEHELSDLVHHLIEIYEGTDTFENFLGIKYITNEKRETETVYDFLRRYSLGRPRDFVAICDKLSEGHEYTMEELKETIVETARDRIVNHAYAELECLLPCLNTTESFNRFIGLINKNVLSYTDLKTICAKFNTKTCCDSKCNTCVSSHPFCDLYKMGLLGVIENPTQNPTFRSLDKNINTANPFQENFTYALHPALMKDATTSKPSNNKKKTKESENKRRKKPDDRLSQDERAEILKTCAATSLTIHKQLSDGRSGSPVYLVYIESRIPGRRGYHIIKLSRNPSGRDESEKSTHIRENAPATFKCHLTRETLLASTSTSSMIISSVANLNPKSICLYKCRLSDKIKFIKRISDDLLTEWNSSNTTCRDVYDFFANLLGQRIQKNGRFEFMSKQLLNNHSAKAIMLGDVLYPNPLAYLPQINRILTQRLPTVEFFKGQVHGDLHLRNIMVSNDLYTMIDYANYDQHSYLLYDHAQMELSQYLSVLKTRKKDYWIKDIDLLINQNIQDSVKDMDCPQELTSFRNAICESIFDWAQSRCPGNCNNILVQFRCARIAAGIKYLCHSLQKKNNEWDASDLNLPERKICLHYTSVCLKNLFENIEHPWDSSILSEKTTNYKK
jgi:hypothetical protein